MIVDHSFPPALESLSTTLLRERRYWLLREFRINRVERPSSRELLHLCRIAVWNAYCAAGETLPDRRLVRRELSRLVRNRNAGGDFHGAAYEPRDTNAAPVVVDHVWASWAAIPQGPASALDKVVFGCGSAKEGEDGPTSQFMQTAKGRPTPTASRTPVTFGFADLWTARDLDHETDEAKLLGEQALSAVVKVLQEQMPKELAILLDQCEGGREYAREQYAARQTDPRVRAAWATKPKNIDNAYGQALMRAREKAKRIIRTAVPAHVLEQLHASGSRIDFSD